MPVRCTYSGGCFWEPTPSDDDVSGHSVIDIPKNFVISHAEDPDGGHLVRIRFETPDDETAFLAALESDRAALAGR